MFGLYTAKPAVHTLSTISGWTSCTSALRTPDTKHRREEPTTEGLSGKVDYILIFKVYCRTGTSHKTEEFELVAAIHAPENGHSSTEMKHNFVV